MEVERPRILVRAPDADNVTQTFSFTPDLLRFSTYLQDTQSEFTQDGAAPRVMEVVYAGTLTARVVEIVDALVGQWVIMGAGEHKEEDIHDAVITCLDSRPDNSNMEKINIFLVFGFLNSFHVTGLLDRVTNVLYRFARHTESWFRCNVQHAHFADRLVATSNSLCAACGTTQVAGTCEKCSTRLQVCSATCLDKVHAMCDPFSFVVPNDTQCGIMQNVLFPASFDYSLGMVGFNEDERTLILSKKSMGKWIFNWKKAHARREPVADRIRWAFVRGRLPDTMPLAPQPDSKWASDREKDLSNILMDIHTVGTIDWYQPYIPLDSKRAVCDMIMFKPLSPLLLYYSHSIESIRDRIKGLCIVYDYLEGLQYMWGRATPPDDRAFNFVLTSAPAHSTDPNARIFRHVLAALTEPLDTESIHFMMKPGDTWGLYRILEGACIEGSVSHVRALLEDGRVDPSLDHNALYHKMIRRSYDDVADVLRNDPRVSSKLAGAYNI